VALGPAVNSRLPGCFNAILQQLLAESVALNRFMNEFGRATSPAPLRTRGLEIVTSGETNPAHALPW